MAAADQAVRRVHALDPDVAVLDVLAGAAGYLLKQKLGMTRRTEAAVYAVRHLEPGQ